MGGTNPPIQGFMVPVSELDFLTVLQSGTRNICSPSVEATIGTPWYTCENIQLTGTVSAVTARVGDSVTIEVGIQALPTLERFEQLILSVQAWVCYPNTVAGETDASLVVPSMQNDQFASFDWSTSGTPLTDAPKVFNELNLNYQQGDSFRWQPLSSWTPTAEDFMDEGEDGGHCCIVANTSGLFDFNGTSGTPVGEQLIVNSEIQAQIDVCTDLYQGQRNIAIVAAGRSGGGKKHLGFGFLSGAPGRKIASKTTVAISAIKQGDKVDPVLHKVLASGPYAGLPLKPATQPPTSIRLARHECGWNDWLCKIIQEAEEIVEELLGLVTHPFGGGHQLHLSLPAHGLHPLRVEVELDPNEPPGTVHAIEITQTDADGERGGIRLGIVVT